MAEWGESSGHAFLSNNRADGYRCCHRKPSSLLGPPASVTNGTLARLAQAAYLLGHVLHLINDSDRNPRPLSDEISQLDQTIWSLTNLSYTEGQIRRMAVCGQTSFCYRRAIT